MGATDPERTHSVTTVPRRDARIPLAALVLTLLVSLTSACDDDSATDSPQAEVATAQVRAAQQRLLDVRDAAVRSGDKARFMATVGRGDAAFVRRQGRWFDNVSQLPWQRFRSVVLRTDWPEALRDPTWKPEVRLPRVRLQTRLRGFDASVVTRVTGLALGRREGGWKVVGDRPPGEVVFPGDHPAPWDLTRVTARERGSALILLDARTTPRGAELVDAVASGVSAVQSGLPFSWSGRVVVYAFGDPQVLRSFRDVPGGNIAHLGALTFPVYASAQHHRTVGLRVTVLPSSLQAGEPFLGRIVRHELTHVALGSRDDAAPLWLSEGIAEYLSARGLPSSERRIAAVALERARADSSAGSTMPPSREFNGAEQDWHYAQSWMACDYIVQRFGEARLWQLLSAFERPADPGIGAGGPAQSTPGPSTAAADARQDAVLMRVIGLDSATLAGHARSRILAIYG